MFWILLVYIIGLPFGYAGLSRLMGSGPLYDTGERLLNFMFALFWPVFLFLGAALGVGWLFMQVATPLEKLAWRLWPKKMKDLKG
jgi:hypothetical protein